MDKWIVYLIDRLADNKRSSLTNINLAISFHSAISEKKKELDGSTEKNLIRKHFF